MKAFVLQKGAKTFTLMDWPEPSPGEGEVLIEAEAFGLNYADVMARNGLYRDAPPRPSVIGYEVLGRVVSLGKGVTAPAVGQRVIAMSRFGGYAEKVVVRAIAAVPVPEGMDVGEALALTVQYSTAWYCAEEVVTLHEEDHVLVQAAAGGVGTALVQMAKRRGCTVYGTAGSEAKLEYLRAQGVDHPINYRKQDYVEVIRKLRGKLGLDVVFDSLGAREFKRAFKLLRPGGAIVGFGNASRSSGWSNVFGDLKTLFGFGFYSGAFLLVNSRQVNGVNMLGIADNRPWILKRCMESVIDLAAKGELNPVVFKKYPASQLNEAHKVLESRKSTGKIVILWE